MVTSCIGPSQILTAQLTAHVTAHGHGGRRCRRPWLPACWWLAASCRSLATLLLLRLLVCQLRPCRRMAVMMALFEALKGYCAQWWFPFVVGALSGVNNFMLVLAGPLALLFCAVSAARPTGSPHVPACMSAQLCTVVGGSARPPPLLTPLATLRVRVFPRRRC